MGGLELHWGASSPEEWRQQKAIACFGLLAYLKSSFLTRVSEAVCTKQPCNLEAMWVAGLHGLQCLSSVQPVHTILISQRLGIRANRSRWALWEHAGHPKIDAEEDTVALAAHSQPAAMRQSVSTSTAFPSNALSSSFVTSSLDCFQEVADICKACKHRTRHIGIDLSLDHFMHTWCQGELGN
eukprot:1149866-Pelagomonas_calceolata.AAC.3